MRTATLPTARATVALPRYAAAPGTCRGLEYCGARLRRGARAACAPELAVRAASLWLCMHLYRRCTASLVRAARLATLLSRHSVGCCTAALAHASCGYGRCEAIHYTYTGSNTTTSFFVLADAFAVVLYTPCLPWCARRLLRLPRALRWPVMTLNPPPPLSSCAPQSRC